MIGFRTLVFPAHILPQPSSRPKYHILLLSSSRVWTSLASQHTCSWEFALFSWFPFPSSDSCIGTKSFITRSLVRSSVGTRIFPGCRFFTVGFFLKTKGSSHKQKGGILPQDYQGGINLFLGCRMLRGIDCLQPPSSCPVSCSLATSV